MHAISVEQSKRWTHELLVIILASLCIGLFGRIAIPLWFTPVPIATQNSVILLMAALLGARRGTLATLLFLAQGAMGFPVFAGASNLAYFFGPTGGYLFGYLLASFVVGAIAEKKRSLANNALALISGHATIYLCGATYLSTFVGWEKALLLGIAPFLLGDMLKIVASLQLLQWKHNSR